MIFSVLLARYVRQVPMAILALGMGVAFGADPATCTPRPVADVQSLLNQKQNGCVNERICCETDCSVEGIQGVTMCSTNSSLPQTLVKPIPKCETITSTIAPNQRYRSANIDYQTETTLGKGCAPCGASSAVLSMGEVPKVTLKRFYHPDTNIIGSFGANWGMNWDLWLQVFPPGTDAGGVPTGIPGWQVMVSQSIDQPIDFFNAVDRTSTGIFTETKSGFFKSLIFYKADNSITANPTLASRAQMTKWSGETFDYEMYEETPGVTLGRFTQFTDRNGNKVVSAWKYAVSDPTLTGGLRAKLRVRSTLTDASSRVFTFTYNEASLVQGMYVVTQIGLPNGSSIGYRYSAQPTMFFGTTDSLVGVDHPDGTVSTISAAMDPASACLKVDFSEPHADAPTSRVKSVWFTVSPWINPANAADQQGQIFGRGRQITNALGELVYVNFRESFPSLDPAYPGLEDRTYSYNQGRVTAIVHHGGDEITAMYQRRIDAGSIFEVNANWDGWDLVSTLVPDVGLLGDKSVTDGAGNTVTYVRDPLSDQVLTVTHPDGSVETTTRNGFQQSLIEVDRQGRKTARVYDAAGNLLSKTEAVGTPAQATWTWTYWLAGDTDLERGLPGQLKAATDANGNVTQYAYFPNGYLKRISEPADVLAGVRAERLFTWDIAGRMTSSTDGAGRLTTYLHDVQNRVVQATYLDTSFETWTYAVSGLNAGLLVQTRDRNGNLKVCDYDAAGRKIIEVQAFGTPIASTESWAYFPGNKNLVTSHTRDGDTVSFLYDERLRRFSDIRQPNQGTTLISGVRYDQADRQISQIDPYGRTTYLVYDTDYRVVRTVRELIAGGVPAASLPTLASLPRILTENPPYVIEDTLFDSTGLTLARFDGRGVQTSYQYDAQRRMTSQTEAVGTPEAATTSIVYDAQGNVIARQNARGFTTSATFSGRNLLLSQTEAVSTPVAATTTFTYSPTKKVATVTDALLRTTSNTYGLCCDRLVRVTDPLGFITAMAYDFVGNRTVMTDANNLATLTTYDARNRPVTITNAAGETTTLAYLDSAAALPESGGLGLGASADGSAMITINPRGERSIAIRDGVGRTVRNVDGLGHQTTMAYDLPVTDAGTALVAMTSTDPLAHTTTAYQDGAGRTRVSLDALNKRSTMGFDAAGNRVTWRDANNIGMDCVFDARNRDVQCTDTTGAVTIKTYDANNNLVATTDALLKVESSVFDPRDRKTSTTDRVPATTTFTYDAVSNLLSITDAEGGITLYQYESRNLLDREVFPNGQTRRTARYYGYDPGRRLTSRTVVGVSLAGTPPATPPTPNEVTTYLYDNANRLTTRGYTDSLNDTFGYDTASRLTSANSARYANQVARIYDAAGRLTKETLSFTTAAEAVDLPVSYQYDNDNRLTQMTYPDGSQVQRAYTVRNELQQVWDAGATQASRLYDDGGRLTSTLYGNGLTESRGYAANDNTTAIISIPGVTNFAYQYDANKRKTAEQDNQVSDQSQRFGYDDQNRVTTWKRSTGIAPADPATEAATWNLSQVGDWTTFSNTQGATTTTQNRLHNKVHELVSINGTALTYDVKGNLTKDDQGQTFTWDFENRLLKAINLAQGQGDSATYGYDALGRRVKQAVKTTSPNNTEPTYYVNAGAQEVVAITGDVTAFNDPTADPEDAGIAPYNSTTGQGARGSLLEDPTATRYNFQPADSDTPDGWLADSGVIQATPTSVGWTAAVTPKDRNHLGRPLYDTFAPVGSSTWKVPVANGTHSVVIMCGDADSRAQTNHLKVNGVAVTDPTPYDGNVTLGYETGSFDGYALTVNVTAGFITIQSGTGALKPKLNFIEVAPAGTTTDAATLARVQAAAVKATHDTGKPKAKTPPTVKRNMWGTYVDELISYTVAKPRHAPVRYYTPANNLYSVAATTDTAGAVVERYSYNVYGVRTVKNSAGATLTKSAVGQDRGFTSYKLDSGSGLYYARARMYSSKLGRFIGRDLFRRSNGADSSLFVGVFSPKLIYIPKSRDGYQDGVNLYNSYFSPNSLDPSGNMTCCKNGAVMWEWNGGFYDSPNDCTYACTTALLSDPLVIAAGIACTFLKHPSAVKACAVLVFAGVVSTCANRCHRLCTEFVKPVSTIGVTLWGQCKSYCRIPLGGSDYTVCEECPKGSFQWD